MNSWLSIDTETSGLEVGSRVVEIAAVRFDADGVLDVFESFVDPGMPIPADVAAFHGITDEIVADAPLLDGVIDELLAWIGTESPAGIIAHNAPYDGGVLAWDCARLGIATPFPDIIDTLAIAKLRGETKRNSLAALMEHHGIEPEGSPHRAGCDARGCAEYFRTVCLPMLDRPAWRLADGPHPFVAAADLPENLRHLPDLVTAAAPLSFTYSDAKGAITTRTITPYGWGRAPWGDVMFHGWCTLREARRTFKAENVQAVEG
jgi:DNA polymerase III epsilon subunit family exonuclease